MRTSPDRIARLLCFFLFALAHADYGPLHYDQEFNDGIWGPYPKQSFLSLPGARAPLPNVIVEPKEGVSPSKHVMWTPSGLGVSHAWPMMLETTNMSLVWYGPPSSKETLHGNVQTCNDTQYITFWYGGLTKNGWKGGKYYLLNDKYETVYTVTGHGELSEADGHEFFLTPQCTAVYTSYKPRYVEATVNDMSTEFNLESYYQEVDLATGELLFTWNASQHIDMADTYWNASIRNAGHSKTHGFDWFHINSVEKDHKGNYLVDSRHTHAIYYVSGETGDLIWQLGGRKNMFKDMSEGTATDFAWQHHVRWVDEELTRISVFDNRITQWHSNERESVSRGIILRLDYDKMEVTLDHEYMARNGIGANREGSVQILKNSPGGGNNVLLGYGQEPAVTEFSEDGEVLWDVLFAPLGLNRKSPDNYRWNKFNWTGNPLSMPDIAPGPPPNYHFDHRFSTFDVRLNDSTGHPLANDTAYFSWNGATEVSKWIVLASNETADLEVSQHFWSEVPKYGFESSVFVGAGTQHVAVMAVNAQDEVLGITSTLDMTTGELSNGLKMLETDDGEQHYDTQQLTEAWHQYIGESPGGHDLYSTRGHWSSLFVLGIVGAVAYTVYRFRLTSASKILSWRQDMADAPRDRAFSMTASEYESDDERSESHRDHEEKGLLHRLSTSTRSSIEPSRRS